jgi:antirestriction protein ArdC
MGLLCSSRLIFSSSNLWYSIRVPFSHLPSKNQFEDAGKYYATALHELGHATGHSSRLNRDLSGGFGSESYAKEELRAEISSLKWCFFTLFLNLLKKTVFIVFIGESFSHFFSEF